MAGLSGYTYATLKQAILDYTEVGSNVFTETILDGFIMAAQHRINLDCPMDSDRIQDQGQLQQILIVLQCLLELYLLEVYKYLIQQQIQMVMVNG